MEAGDTIGVGYYRGAGLHHLISRRGAQDIVNSRVAQGIGDDRFRGLNRASVWWYKGHRDARHRPAGRIGYFGDERVVQGLAHSGSQIFWVDRGDPGGLPIARQKEVVSTAGSEEKQGEQRDD